MLNTHSVLIGAKRIRIAMWPISQTKRQYSKSFPNHPIYRFIILANHPTSTNHPLHKSTAFIHSNTTLKNIKPLLQYGKEKRLRLNETAIGAIGNETGILGTRILTSLEEAILGVFFFFWVEGAFLATGCFCFFTPCFCFLTTMCYNTP